MPVETALSAWQSLKSLAGKGAKVHITGGEPFLYYDRLVELMTQAHKLKLTPLDMIETNGFWAVNDKIIIERLKLLRSLGMQRLKISWDPFHAEFVDSAVVKRLAATAVEILGPEAVLVRWKKYLDSPIDTSSFSDNRGRELYKSAVKDYPCRFTGRAGGQLAALFADKTIESLSADNCKSAFLSAGGVHVDPYGNVFSGLCSGIITGNVNNEGLEKIWEEFDPAQQRLIGSVFANGPSGLLSEAVESGYKPMDNYANKCHLCSDLRKFFFDIGMYKPIIGPYDCYRQ